MTDPAAPPAPAPMTDPARNVAYDPEWFARTSAQAQHRDPPPIDPALMMNKPAPKPPPAVRLARVARPADRWIEWDLKPNTIALAPDAEADDLFWSCNNLNDLAQVERRVCEAGHSAALHAQMARRAPEMDSGWELVWASASARAAALIAFLDANPAVEAALTRHE